MIRAYVETQKVKNTRLFQVNLPIGEGPLMIAAASFETAVDIALQGRSRADLRGSAMVWDATQEWGELSLRVLGHTALLLASGIEAIVDYDEERGWIARMNP